MPRRLLQLLVVTTLILAVGAHWAILQSVAWVGMAITYSQNAPIAEALQKTFDGQHPCKLCKIVRNGKNSEQKQTVLKVETKLDFWLVGGAALPDVPPPAVIPCGPSHPIRVRFESPPVPPPKFV